MCCCGLVLGALGRDWIVVVTSHVSSSYKLLELFLVAVLTSDSVFCKRFEMSGLVEYIRHH